MEKEKELIDQCKLGVGAAQKELYLQYKHLWFTICLRYVHKREDALDVLQNALIKIFSKLNTFDSKLGNFKSWSTKVVVNESIMFQRKYWNTPEVGGVNFELINETVESDALANLSLEYMTKLIQELPHGYRIVFNLYEIDGYSHKEIAEKLGISVGTSKSQLFKAKSILKKKLEPIYKEEFKLIS